MKKKILIPFLALGILLATVSFKKDFFEIAKQIEIFTTLFKELNMNYVDETTPSDLINKAIKGMLDDLDPYTVYWNEQEVEDARINNSGVYTGIGATVRNKDGKMVVLEPLLEVKLYITGLTPCLTATLLAAKEAGVESLILMHYDRESGKYVPQDVSPLL